MSEPSTSYSWLRDVFDQYDNDLSGTPKHWSRGQESMAALSKAVAAIEQHIDEHYVGKGEALANDDGEPLKVTVEVAGGINNITVHVENPKSVADYHKAMDMIKNLFAGPKLYTEQEVEQRCIEAAITELHKFKSAARKAQGLLGGHAMISAEAIRQQVNQQIAQLSTNNKDTGYKDKNGTTIHDGDMFAWGTHVGLVHQSDGMWVFGEEEFGLSPCNLTGEVVKDTLERNE